MKIFKTPSQITPIIDDMTQKLVVMSDENIDFLIFQDFIAKHEYGIPSGVVSIAKNRIYPGAIPDLGCGFRILKLIGITKKDIDNPLVIKKINDYLNGSISEISKDYRDSINIANMATFGHNSTKFLFNDDRSVKYENNGMYPIAENHTFNLSIFNEDKKNEIFGKYQGHFLEFLTSYKDEDTVYLFIHTGSFMLADWFRQFYYPKIATISIKANLSSLEDITNERFFIPSTSNLYEMFLNDARGLMNFSISYRDIIEFDLINILSHELNITIDVELLSDLSHTNIYTENEKIFHLRGVQRIFKSDSIPFVVSGNFGVGSLLFKSNTDQFIGHGVQVQINKFEELLEKFNFEECMFLISKDLIRDKTDRTLLLRAAMSKINYNYYLSNDCVLVDYMIPFYSFKEQT